MAYIGRAERRRGLPEPHEQVRATLERLRADGAAFEEAWRFAVDGIRWSSSRERKDLRGIYEDAAVREAWGRAYDRRPCPAGEAISRAWAFFETLEESLSEELAA